MPEKIMLNTIEEIRKNLNKVLVDLSVVRKQYKEEKESLEKSQEYLEETKIAQEIVQNISQNIQQQVHNKIAGVVDKCLKGVFTNKDYGFKIEFEKKRGRTEAKLVLLNDDHEIDDPLDADSGGILDVASFALRLSCLMLSKPILRRVIIMDEPFKNVSLSYKENVRNLLTSLSKEFKIQFIMVSHDSVYQCGKIINL
jgi:DNA repair exonuclease SbcCD ATPase subunit